MEVNDFRRVSSHCITVLVTIIYYMEGHFSGGNVGEFGKEP